MSRLCLENNKRISGITITKVKNVKVFYIQSDMFVMYWNTDIADKYVKSNI